jgi:hypothetical protein
VGYSAIVIGIVKIPVVGIPIAIPVEISGDNVYSQFILTSLKSLVRNFCILWLKI